MFLILSWSCTLLLFAEASVRRMFLVNGNKLGSPGQCGPVSGPIKIKETAIDFGRNWTELLKWNNVFFCHLIRTRIMLHKHPQ